MKTKSQSGRSMVEMLGVLAIIGVLSVGGIAGYSLSMRRHRANQIIDIASKFALLAYNKCQFYIDPVVDVSAIEDIEECGIYSFSDFDIGDLPAGVTRITAEEISTDSKTGVDIVHISALFDDDKLCQAVGSAVGTECIGSAVPIKIKQN